MKNPFKDRLLLLAFLVILVAFGALVARKYLVSRPAPQTVAPATTPEEVRQLREVVLYFGSAEGTHLVPEGREIDCLEEDACVRETVQSLINGPIGDLVPVLPSHTVLREVSLADGTAVLDFSRDIIAGHPGGSISELLTVYSLADTLAVNFPHIRQVQILVEGNSVETLKGHLGLQEPIKADFRYTRPPEQVDPETGTGESQTPSEGRSL